MNNINQIQNLDFKNSLSITIKFDRNVWSYVISIHSLCKDTLIL